MLGGVLPFEDVHDLADHEYAEEQQQSQRALLILLEEALHRVVVAVVVAQVASEDVADPHNSRFRGRYLVP